jgi:hypothetical protein
LTSYFRSCWDAFFAFRNFPVLLKDFKFYDFRMSKVNALPKNYGTCAFCSMDFPDVYRCPRCKQLFCGVKCYRSTGHSGCSEDFYKAQIEQHLALQGESVSYFLNIIQSASYFRMKTVTMKSQRQAIQTMNQRQAVQDRNLQQKVRRMVG